MDINICSIYMLICSRQLTNNNLECFKGVLSLVVRLKVAICDNISLLDVSHCMYTTTNWRPAHPQQPPV